MTNALIDNSYAMGSHYVLINFVAVKSVAENSVIIELISVPQKAYLVYSVYDFADVLDSIRYIFDYATTILRAVQNANVHITEMQIIQALSQRL